MTQESRNRGRPKTHDPALGQNIIQAVDRAIDVLEVLADGGAMTLSQIATKMGQSPATLYRILCTFQARDIVENDAVTQEWTIGANAFRIGAKFLRRNNVVLSALPAMRHLMETTGETSNLGIEKAGKVVFISQVETNESIRAFFPPGTQAPMHASGIGKALLSTFSDVKLAQYVKEQVLTQFTHKTICTGEDLIGEVKRIRALGYSFDDEEKAVGMRCIAAPIFDHQGQAVAGISISGPSHRLSVDMVTQIGAIVKAAARDVSRSLGADLDD